MVSFFSIYDSTVIVGGVFLGWLYARWLEPRRGEYETHGTIFTVMGGVTLTFVLFCIRMFLMPIPVETVSAALIWAAVWFVISFISTGIPIAWWQFDVWRRDTADALQYRPHWVKGDKK